MVAEVKFDEFADYLKRVENLVGDNFGESVCVREPEKIAEAISEEVAPVLFNVEYLDGLWIYRNEELNLWGRGNRREKALEDLRENFDYLWSEIVQEEDERLDKKAMEIKKKLLALVGERHAG